MDLIKILKGVKNLKDYLSITEELNLKYKNEKISLNMSTVISLRNIRSLEIEYFNKCHESGAAFYIFGRILSLPPSKTWSLLGKDLISLLQYWLDAVRKHLISHHPHWWSFLKTLLKFIKELSKKEHSLNDTLVQELSECLLDLATRGRTDVFQRHEILHTFNQYCAESGREIRQALGVEFDHYFVRLSTIMASCGHVPTQFSTLETLLRWLLPRRDPSLRKEAAAKWFPNHLYSIGASQIFLERPWMNFFQDARDLLNAHNQCSSHVTSVVCRKLSFGERTIVSVTEKRLTFLDLNCGSGTLSILLDHSSLEALNLSDHSACETILIHKDNIRVATLYKESVHVFLSITMLEPLKLFPSCIKVLECSDVTAVISGRRLISGVDAALRTIFQEKYEVLMDIENEALMLSPERFYDIQEEETTFSRSGEEVGRRVRSGFQRSNRNSASWKSPSTTSTTSLAQLHDKLVTLPKYKFDKEPVSVCAQPKLSRLTELSESDDKQSATSTLKLGAFGVCVRSHQSQSDSEVKRSTKATKANDKQTNSKKRKSKSDSEKVKKTNNYSEIVEDSRNASLLLSAIVGSTDESVINDTLERLSTVKDYSNDNIAYTLIQEAFQAKAIYDEDEKCLDSGINTGDGKKTQNFSETTSDILVEKTTLFITENDKNHTIISKSTSTDESNTEAINDTPMCYVNVRKKNPHRKNTVEKNLQTISETPYEVQTVEDIFSQHFNENTSNNLIISPTLARKINETSSESSELGDCLLRDDQSNVNFDQYEIPCKEIIECLNQMVDKVCDDFNKILKQEKGSIGNLRETETEDIPRVVLEKTPLEDVGNINESGKDKLDGKDSKSTKTRGLKLKYNLYSKSKKTISSKKLEISKELEPVKMSYVNKCIEEPQIPGGPEKKPKSKNRLDSAEKSNVVLKDIREEPRIPASPENNSSPKNYDLGSRFPRRKRKLYSPKDEKMTSSTENANININVPSNNDNEKSIESDDSTILELKKCHSIIPKTTATSYRDIEKDRKRIKKTRTKKVASPISPKTKNLNEVFDHLKENIDSNEKITLADKKEFGKDMAIFNFTSDSEDEDFKKKRDNIHKRISTTTIESGNSVLSRRGRTRTKVDDTKKEKGSSDETVKPIARRKGKRQNSKTKTLKAVVIDRPTDLVDEKIRAVVPDEDALQTTFVIEKTNNEATNDLNPAIQISEMEFVSENEINATKNCDDVKKKKKFKKNERAAAKKEKVTKTTALEVVKEKDDDGTISPLPGLLVETVTPRPHHEDSLTSNFVQKVTKMYKTGADLGANETNTTQNLCFDNEKTNHSSQMNIIEDFDYIQENFEDKSNFDVKSPNENGLEIKNCFEISPVKIVKSNNKSYKLCVSGKTSVSSTKSNHLKSNLRLKSSYTASQPASDTKFSLRSVEMTAKTIKRQDVVEHSILTNIDKEIHKFNPQTEIICIDDITPNQTKFYAEVNNNQEKFQLNEDGISEKSIATNGITAHRDSSEEPPSQKSLEQPLEPREMTDMDESLLDYYVKLRKGIVNPYNSHSNETTVSSKENEAKVKVLSPVVSLKRISSGDIRKYTSPTKEKIEDYDYRRWLPSQKNSDSDQKSKFSEKSVSVSVNRLSSKEIDEWTNQSENNNISDKFRLAKLDNAQVKKSCLNRHETINSPNPNKHKSIISPIKLWDDIPEREYPSKIKEKPPIKTSSKEVSRTEKVSTSKCDTDLSSPVSNLSSSIRQDSRIQKSPAKRSLPKNKDKDVKRRKVEVNVDLNQSGPSMSSVDDWLTRMEHNKDASIDDTIQNIMERLDTTVNEIHQNTSKRFVHLFVDAQQHLNALRAEQTEMRRKTATDILTGVAQIIEEKFSELDRLSQQRQENFMETLKQQALKFIKDDHKHKQDMIFLLQEDVQAAKKKYT